MEREKERDIIIFCVCELLKCCVNKMPAVAHGLQRYRAKSFGQSYRLTYLLTEWFIELHSAAINILVEEAWPSRYIFFFAHTAYTFSYCIVVL